MKKYVQAITVLLLFSAMGLSGCDQVKELAIQEADKVKKDVVSEIAKAVNGENQDKKEDGQSSKETEKEEGEKK